MADSESRSNAPKPPKPPKLSVAERSTIPQIVAMGQSLSFHQDFYHFVLRLSWGAFLGLISVVFLVMNVIFACFYMIVPGSVLNAESFIDYFFFSVETLATIGYGVMSPQNRWAHAIVTMEAFAGIATTAMITGLIFVRFARPTAKILFSDKMVICNRDGVPHLMFRIANWRRNQISEAQLNVMLLLTETSTEGETMRRPQKLDLVREKNPMFALSWTVMHKIDETSPFYGPDAMTKLHEQKAELFLALSGLDETLMQTIVARWRYQLDDIVHNARFADVLVLRDDGTRVIDYDMFNEVITVEESATKMHLLDTDKDKEGKRAS
jgi:inward rectifier potassium channel